MIRAQRRGSLHHAREEFSQLQRKIQVELPGSLSVNERFDIESKREAHAGYVFPVDLL